MKILYLLSSLAAYSPFNHKDFPAELSVAHGPASIVETYWCPEYTNGNPTYYKLGRQEQGDSVICEYGWGKGTDVQVQCSYNRQSGQLDGGNRDGWEEYCVNNAIFNPQSGRSCP